MVLRHILPGSRIVCESKVNNIYEKPFTGNTSCDRFFYMKLVELRERVFLMYKDCHDIDVALLRCHVTDPAIRQNVLDDNLFNIRMLIEDAEYKGRIHAKIESLSNSALADSTRLQATKMLATAFYPERYREKLDLSGKIDYAIIPRAKAAVKTGVKKHAR
jgi:hypothetical protein